MALAKTNATAFSLEPDVDNSFYSEAMISTSDANVNISNSCSHGDIVIAWKIGKNYDSTTGYDLFVSSDAGVNFSVVHMGFKISDVIYSSALGKFICSGFTGNKTSSDDNTFFFKASTDGITWADVVTDLYAPKVVYGLLEDSEGAILIAGHGKPSSNSVSNTSFTAKLKKNSSGGFTASNIFTSNMIYLGAVSSLVKGNGKIIVAGTTGTGSSLSRFIFANESVNSADKTPDLFADGRFIIIASTSVYKSINGVDYTLVGQSAIAMKKIVKSNGYFYGFTDTKICRAATLDALVAVPSEDYVDIGETVTYNHVFANDAYMVLFCVGFALKVVIKGGSNNPAIITIGTISATEALKQAKEYTDAQYALLEARIAALENK